LLSAPLFLYVCSPLLIFFSRLMRSPFCLSVCPRNYFIFNAVRIVTKDNRRIILSRTPCVYYEITLLPVCVVPQFFRFLCSACRFREAYEIALLSVRPIFLFLRGSCRMKGKQAIIPSQNFLFHFFFLPFLIEYHVETIIIIMNLYCTFSCR
jgi:hypothetical protein